MPLTVPVQALEPTGTNRVPRATLANQPHMLQMNRGGGLTIWICLRLIKVSLYINIIITVSYQKYMLPSIYIAYLLVNAAIEQSKQTILALFCFTNVVTLPK